MFPVCPLQAAGGWHGRYIVARVSRHGSDIDGLSDEWQLVQLARRTEGSVKKRKEGQHHNRQADSGSPPQGAAGSQRLLTGRQRN
jgi:hypothetical protein